MALSGTINGTTNTTLVRVKVDWTQVQNVAANTSTVTFKLYARRTDRSTAYFEGRGTWYLHTNNTKLTGKTVTLKLQATSDGQGIWTLIGTWSKTFTHTSAGTCTVKVQATGGYTYSSAYYTSTTLGADITLEPIVQAVPSTLTLDQTEVTVNGTNSVTCSIERTMTAAYHRIRYYVQGHETAALTVDPQQSVLEVNVTLPQAWWAYISSVADGDTAVFELITYSDSERTDVIGTDTQTLTVFLPQGAGGPVVSAGWYTLTPSGGSAALESAGLYVQGVSRAHCVFDTTKISPRGGYAVTQKRFGIGGTWYTDLSALLTSPGTLTVTIQAVDSRGAVTQEQASITVQAYQSPSITSPQAVRSNAQGQEQATGTYFKISAGAAVSSLSGWNTYTMTAARKNKAGGSYGAESTLTSGTPLILSGAMADATYDVRITLTDRIGNTAQTVLTVPRAAGYYLGFHMRAYGTGAAFGQKNDRDGWLQINYAGGLQLIQGKIQIGNTTLSEQQLQALLALIQ